MTLKNVFQTVSSVLLVTLAISSSVMAVILTMSVSKVIDGNTLRVSDAGKITQSAHKDFDWKVYFDPKNPEFWDDGAGEPPRPFRHVAANPTKENISNLRKWITLQENKIAEVRKLIGDEGVQENEKGIKDLKELLSSHKAPKKDRSDVSSQIDLVYIYSSTCSACKASKEVVEKLKLDGVRVTSLQTDFAEGLDRNALPYTGEYKTSFPSAVTPTFYIKVGDVSAVKIEGFKPYNELMATISRHVEQELKSRS
jgi:hypothetical protein